MAEKIKSTIGARFRRNFATGLLVLAPIWATIYLVIFVVRLIGGYLSPLMRKVAEQLYDGETWLAAIRVAADIMAFVITVLSIAIVGFLVRKVIGQRLIKLLEQILKRIPVIREIYDGVSKFLQMLFGDKAGFQRVVAVKFPSEHSWSVGFVTNTRAWAIPLENKQEMLSVFVPTTPNPTSGFLILCESTSVVPLEISVDDAVKLVISGGTLNPGSSARNEQGGAGAGR